MLRISRAIEYFIQKRFAIKEETDLRKDMLRAFTYETATVVMGNHFI